MTVKSEQKLDEAVGRADEILRAAERNARDFITFADGLEEAGMVVYAQRGRVVATDLLRYTSELRAERSARVSIQKERDRFRELATRQAV